MQLQVIAHTRHITTLPGRRNIYFIREITKGEHKGLYECIVRNGAKTFRIYKLSRAMIDPLVDIDALLNITGNKLPKLMEGHLP